MDLEAVMTKTLLLKFLIGFSMFLLVYFVGVYNTNNVLYTNKEITNYVNNTSASLSNTFVSYQNLSSSNWLSSLISLTKLPITLFLFFKMVITDTFSTSLKSIIIIVFGKKLGDLILNTLLLKMVLLLLQFIDLVLFFLFIIFIIRSLFSIFSSLFST